MKSKKFKYRNADGQMGLILRSIDGGPCLFRIYGENGSFKDYDILHHDIKVQIMDDSAEFLESADGESCYLDYSRSLIGQEKKYDRED